jgi:hypothetical protein
LSSLKRDLFVVLFDDLEVVAGGPAGRGAGGQAGVGTAAHAAP